MLKKPELFREQWCACHSSNSLCYHLSHGDQLGPCSCKNSSIIEEQLTESFKAFPNPFNGTTTIEFVGNQAEFISLDIFSMQGAIIKNLYEGEITAGQQYQFGFTPGNLAQQIYVVRLATPNRVKYLKLLLLK